MVVDDLRAVVAVLVLQLAVTLVVFRGTASLRAVVGSERGGGAGSRLCAMVIGWGTAHRHRQSLHRRLDITWVYQPRAVSAVLAADRLQTIGVEVQQ